MARRKLLKIQDRQELFGVPTDEDSLIRHYTLSPADRLEIAVQRRKHNQLGFAAQLCMMRYPGRTLMANEIPPRAMLNYIAEQLDADPKSFSSYARRDALRRWADRLMETKPFKLVAVATANKLARIAFALMCDDARYADTPA